MSSHLNVTHTQIHYPSSSSSMYKRSRVEDREHVDTTEENKTEKIQQRKKKNNKTKKEDRPPLSMQIACLRMVKEEPHTVLDYLCRMGHLQPMMQRYLVSRGEFISTAVRHLSLRRRTSLLLPPPPPSASSTSTYSTSSTPSTSSFSSLPKSTWRLFTHLPTSIWMNHVFLFLTVAELMGTMMRVHTHMLDWVERAPMVRLPLS